MASDTAGLAIESRRYLGNKASIAPWIVERTTHHLDGSPASVVDLFAGTGSVAWAFNTADTAITASDLLYSNYLCLRAWLGVKQYRRSQLLRWVTDLNQLSTTDENYASENFGDRYWPHSIARHIGAARDAIDHLPASDDERAVLVASLLYAADRLANTCGHYDAWRRVAEPQPQRLCLRLPEVDPGRNRNNIILCADANHLVRSVEADVVYLDPPYNSRQYSDTYHVLENLARWEKPALHGVARKMDRRSIKSQYCMQGAATAFTDLIDHVKARLVVVSYNNMGQRGDPRSNACIPDQVLLEALQRRGKVYVEERDFRPFNAGKRLLSGHRERLFVCRIR